MASVRFELHVSQALHRLVVVVGALALAAVVATPRAHAQIGSERYSSIVIEAASGKVLSAANPDDLRHPASLAKMMTLYMVFEALRDRRISLDQDVPVSPHAASMEPSKLGLLPGMRITVEEAILGLVTKSANDAAAALGEFLSGDEERFAQVMTLRARALGMSRTVFRNASGLPDIDQVTTARDLATLGRHLVQDFPSEYRYFSTPSFVFRGRMVYNHDLMLQRYPGADGMKTGYIETAGHNLVTSALRGDVRLIGVVLGASSNPQRDAHMAGLLDAGFEQLNVPVVPHWAMQASAASVNGLTSGGLAATLRQETLPNSLRSPGLAGPGLRAAIRTAAPELPRPARLNVAVIQRWGVEVGTFVREAEAKQAALAARRAAGDGEARVEQTGTRSRYMYHAQLGGFTEAEARDACASISRRRMACAPFRLDSGQLASR
jgi:D-alanyl-D-alanine carboxypeptidase